MKKKKVFIGILCMFIFGQVTCQLFAENETKTYNSRSYSGSVNIEDVITGTWFDRSNAALISVTDVTGHNFSNGRTTSNYYHYTIKDMNGKIIEQGQLNHFFDSNYISLNNFLTNPPMVRKLFIEGCHRNRIVFTVPHLGIYINWFNTKYGG